jgi:hypothetical protein
MIVRTETYERVALEEPGGKRELVCGRLRQKPSMTRPKKLTKGLVKPVALPNVRKT